MKNNEILKKASFEEKQGVKILKINGSPYEMGYQHGFLLADKINQMIAKTLLGTIAYISAQTGKTLAQAQALIWVGQETAEPFIPSELMEEMHGIKGGANAAGINITLKQMLHMWSLISYPESGDFWLAINNFPAQYGGYEKFNLHQLLNS